MNKSNGRRAPSRVLRLCAPLAAATLAIAAVAGGGPALANDLGASRTADQWADNITMLAAQMRAEVARLPADSSSEAFEGAILFLVEQSGEPENVVCASLDVVRPEATTPVNAQSAMANICRRMTGRRGTGAIANSGNGFGASSFSTPIISTGGGSSGYAP